MRKQVDVQLNGKVVGTAYLEIRGDGTYTMADVRITDPEAAEKIMAVDYSQFSLPIEDNSEKT